MRKWTARIQKTGNRYFTEDTQLDITVADAPALNNPTAKETIMAIIELKKGWILHDITSLNAQSIIISVGTTINGTHSKEGNRKLTHIIHIPMEYDFTKAWLNHIVDGVTKIEKVTAYYHTLEVMVGIEVLEFG